MSKLRYTGPDGAISREIGDATGASPQLEHGRDYDLPAALAKRLLASNVHFEPVTKGGKTDA